ncbi:hypothetical protein PR202_gb27766 [Eleusine coracana subsp. coracana]|uniref:Leucine-rich repeat-containing N-terminal plant-type domain-containing protein n=1 Tax=Eleusine coracana subsp. coracana TaxID=191504 RepID=A0AAV5FVW5_ELECO|nr:hypothetical protein PR202_gb27766 [Eleusine coracana subsp. coracana]
MLEVEEWHNGYKAPSSTPTRSNQISSSLLEVETSSTTMHHLATTTSFVLLIVVATSTCFSAASISQRLSPPLNGTTTTGACLPRERDALLAFKRGITADPVGRLSSWRRGTDCCRWEGVQCARRTGHVLKLQLQIPFYYDDESRKKEGLTGRISPSLFALEHLQQLDLSVNYLEGPLPSEIVAVFFPDQASALWDERPGVPEVTRPLLRRLLVAAIGLANAFLLCSLAGAAFTAAFVVLRYRIFAAFAPLVITAIICLLLRYCVASEADDDERENQDRQERIKATEDLASKVTMFAAIMVVLGASIGEKQSRTRDMIVLILTSAFVCAASGSC